MLFEKALNLTLINVQKSLLEEIDNISKSIDFENQRKIDSLNIRLKSAKTLNDLMYIKKKRFLLEQSKIAKVLGIEKNQLNITSNVNISETGKLPYSQKFNTEDLNFPYYLRGFKAIDKEIQLIESRSENENNLMTEGYFILKQKLLLIENDIRSKNLREASQTIKNDNIFKWVSFNLELSEEQNLKKPHLYIPLSIILGAILGILYVLIRKVFEKRKEF